MKDVGLRIRVQRELRDKFTHACREKDVPAAHVLREFMREYVARHEVKTNSVQASRAKASEQQVNRCRGKGR